MTSLARVLSIGLLTALPATASAATIVFNFESTPATFVQPPDIVRAGDLTSLSLTESGLTAVVTRPGSAFDIVENSGSQAGKPAGFGARSLDPFFAEGSPAPFIVDFSAPIFGAAIDFGDYGGDTPDVLTLEFFSGAGATGALLGSTTAAFPGAFPSFSTASLLIGSGALSIRFIGGTGQFPNSVFYDNLRVETTVPEPASMLLFAAGAAGLATRRLRRRARVQ